MYVPGKDRYIVCKNYQKEILPYHRGFTPHGSWTKWRPINT